MSKVVKFPNSNPALVSLREAGLHSPVRYPRDWDDIDLGMAIQALSEEHARGGMPKDKFLAEAFALGMIAGHMMNRSFGAEG